MRKTKNILLKHIKIGDLIVFKKDYKGHWGNIQYCTIGKVFKVLKKCKISYLPGIWLELHNNDILTTVSNYNTDRKYIAVRWYEIKDKILIKNK